MDSLETLLTFGLMQFGAGALDWDIDILYKRIGIAIELYKNGVVKRL